MQSGDIDSIILTTFLTSLHEPCKRVCVLARVRALSHCKAIQGNFEISESSEITVNIKSFNV